MFCPHCGVKNDGSPIRCSSCKKSIPPLDARPATPSQRARPRSDDSRSDRLGSVGDRMLAILLDRLAIAAILLMAAAWIGDNWSGIQPRLPSLPIAGSIAALSVFVFVFLYHLIFEAAFGTTLGKAVMGLQVANQSERGRFASAALRNILRVVDSLGFYLVGFLTATFTRQRQRIGDLVAGTVVLDLPMAKGARAAMMALLVTVLVSSIWVAYALCPGCSEAVAKLR